MRIVGGFGRKTRLVIVAAVLMVSGAFVTRLLWNRQELLSIPLHDIDQGPHPPQVVRVRGTTKYHFWSITSDAMRQGHQKKYLPSFIILGVDIRPQKYELPMPLQIHDSLMPRPGEVYSLGGKLYRYEGPVIRQRSTELDFSLADDQRSLASHPHFEDQIVIQGGGFTLSSPDVLRDRYRFSCTVVMTDVPDAQAGPACRVQWKTYRTGSRTGTAQPRRDRQFHDYAALHIGDEFQDPAGWFRLRVVDIAATRPQEKAPRAVTLQIVHWKPPRNEEELFASTADLLPEFDQLIE